MPLARGKRAIGGKLCREHSQSLDVVFNLLLRTTNLHRNSFADCARDDYSLRASLNTRPAHFRTFERKPKRLAPISSVA